MSRRKPRAFALPVPATPSLEMAPARGLELAERRRVGKPRNRDEAGFPAGYEGDPFVVATVQVRREDLERLAELGEIRAVETPPDEPPHPDYPAPDPDTPVSPWLVSYLQNQASQPGVLGREYVLPHKDALVKAMRPATPVEAMMAVQLVELHHATTQALMEARTRTGSPMPFAQAEAEEKRRQAWASLAIRYADATRKQAEALARLQGKASNQTVRVEHVTVGEGGQAIIGNVGAKHGE